MDREAAGYIGIDPGLGGGIAMLDASGAVLTLLKMPETEVDLLAALVGLQSPLGPRRALMERVGVMPKQGLASAFTFGRGVGALLMGLTAAHIPFDQCTPQTWQKALGCLSKGDKRVTKQRAQQLFPGVAVTHALADALLIAEFCRRLERGA